MLLLLQVFVQGMLPLLLLAQLLLQPLQLC
jgi:hypothetical protein